MDTTTIFFLAKKKTKIMKARTFSRFSGKCLCVAQSALGRHRRYMNPLEQQPLSLCSISLSSVDCLSCSNLLSRNCFRFVLSYTWAVAHPHTASARVCHRQARIIDGRVDQRSNEESRKVKRRGRVSFVPYCKMTQARTLPQYLV